MGVATASRRVKFWGWGYEDASPPADAGKCDLGKDCYGCACRETGSSSLAFTLATLGLLLAIRRRRPGNRPLS